MSAIVSRFRETVTRYPDRPAVIGPNETISYRELESRIAAAAAAIRQHTQGNTVALLCPNTPAFPVLLLAAMWAGKTVAILPTLAPAPLLKLMAAEVGAELVITTEEFVPRLVELQVSCWIGEAREKVDPDTFPVQPLAQEASILLYTSGTTGRPKAVMLSECNVLDNAAGSRDAIGFDYRDVMLAILPLFHAYGLTVTIVLPLTEGAAIVIPDRFIPRAILQTIERHKVTAFVAVPGQYRVLVKEPVNIDGSSLRICIAGAERLPDQVALEFRERFHREILQGYGATEVSPVVSVNPPNANHIGSVGRALPNLQVSILDENDRPVPPNETGEVCIQGSAVMLGYFNDPATTEKKIRNGILHTGDKGFLDNDGYLHLVGRADDLVKISGEKVYPAEVETALETIEGVDEAAVIAQPDERHGARLSAFIMPKAGVTLDETLIRAACRERMENYKIPRSFTFVEQMPRTATGKTDKRTLATR
jgi:long-chain acyl-CoA synthetase